MPHIDTGNEFPGIISLMQYKPKTGEALSHLAHTLLIEESPLSSADREMIAAYVSNLNECNFCHLSHTAAFNAHIGDNGETMSCIIQNIDTANISDKIKSLLQIARLVQQSGKQVSSESILQAKSIGATDEEIHDTVLIAAAFCMYNRYVDGLGTTGARPEDYAEMGKRMTKGYK